MADHTILTYTGHRWDVTDVSTWVFDIRDIAFSLSNVPRFAGHVEFKSIAEHSLEVFWLLRQWGAPVDVQLAGLLHDGPEAYLLDIPRPWKSLVSIGNESYYEVEDRMTLSMMSQFGVLNAWLMEGHGLIKDADMEAYEKEAGSRPFVPRSGKSPRATNNIFLAKFNELHEAVHGLA